MAPASAVPRPDPKNARAQTCVGDGSLYLAKYRGDDKLYENAAKAYGVVAGLAGARTEAAAAAWESQGNVYSEWIKLRGNVPTYLENARLAYVAAADVSATPSRLLGLARIEAKQNSPNVIATYSRLNAQPVGPGFTAAEKANSLREHARLLAARDPAGRGGTAARALWDMAAGLIETNQVPGANEANFEVAMIDFASGADATGPFMKASRATNDQSQATFVSQAHYYLGVIDARKSVWSSAMGHASAAGSGVPGATRVACLAFIALGDKADFQALQDTDKSNACKTGTGPEGLLLKGLYNLRRAQFVSNACTASGQTNCRGSFAEAKAARESFLLAAGDAFRDGSRALTNTDTRFDWLLQGDATAFKLVDLLRAGDDMTTDLRTYTQINGQCGAREQTYAAVKAFYERMDLLKCRPKDWQ